jgi:hypothetical protein
MRADPATLVRCAATSKDHLRSVADPAFLRRYGQRLDGRFVPSLLLGVCVYLDHDDQSDRRMAPPGPAPAATLRRSLGDTLSATLRDWSYSPDAACGGLLSKSLPRTATPARSSSRDVSSTPPDRSVTPRFLPRISAAARSCSSPTTTTRTASASGLSP